MFGKTNKKVTIKMSYQEEGHGGSATTVPLNEGKLLDYLKHALNTHGELTITRILDGELHVTTSRTLEHQDMNNRIDEVEEFIRSNVKSGKYQDMSSWINDVGDLIRNYVKSKAIEMDAYAVFAKGELKGVFGQGYNAGFKQSKLLREGYSKEEIEVKPIQIESFKDLE